MKNRLLLLGSLLLFGTVTAFAQGGGNFQRRTVEERVKMVHAKLDSALKLDASKLTEVDSIFAGYYRSQDKLREEMMSSGGQPDFQQMREKMQPLVADRDDKLKKVLTEEQFKKWKDEIEPSMRPQRRQGGGGNR